MTKKKKKTDVGDKKHNDEYIDPKLRVTRPVMNKFTLNSYQIRKLAIKSGLMTEENELSLEEIQELLKEEIEKREEKLRSAFFTNRLAFQFCPQITPQDELKGFVLIDLFDSDKVSPSKFAKLVREVDGRIQLLMNGMMAVDDEAVTLAIKKGKGHQPLMPHFYHVKFHGPESGRWSAVPQKGMTRITVSMEELKRIIERSDPGQGRYYRTFASDTRRQEEIWLQGQSYKANKQSKTLESETVEVGRREPQQILVARAPFSVRETVRKGGTIVSLKAHSYNKHDFKVVHDHSGKPLVEVYYHNRPIVFLIEKDLLKRLVVLFAKMQARERAHYEEDYLLEEFVVKTRNFGNQFKNAVRAEFAPVRSETEESVEDEPEEVSTAENSEKEVSKRSKKQKEEEVTELDALLAKLPLIRNSFEQGHIDEETALLLAQNVTPGDREDEVELLRSIRKLKPEEIREVLSVMQSEHESDSDKVGDESGDEESPQSSTVTQESVDSAPLAIPAEPDSNETGDEDSDDETPDTEESVESAEESGEAASSKIELAPPAN